MRSERSREGFLIRDDRVSGGTLLEAATYTCSHCHTVVILDPLRSRPREKCLKCDHLICDRCGLLKKISGGVCESLERTFDRLQEQAAKEENQHG